MAKQLLQTIKLVDGNETSLPCIENGVQPTLPERIQFLEKNWWFISEAGGGVKPSIALSRVNHMNVKAVWNLRDLFTGNPY